MAAISSFVGVRLMPLTKSQAAALAAAKPQAVADSTVEDSASVPCAQCGKWFVPPHPRAIYCDRFCQMKKSVEQHNLATKRIGRPPKLSYRTVYQILEHLRMRRYTREFPSENSIRTIAKQLSKLGKKVTEGSVQRVGEEFVPDEYWTD